MRNIDIGAKRSQKEKLESFHLLKHKLLRSFYKNEEKLMFFGKKESKQKVKEQANLVAEKRDDLIAGEQSGKTPTKQRQFMT